MFVIDACVYVCGPICVCIDVYYLFEFVMVLAHQKLKRFEKL